MNDDYNTEALAGVSLAANHGAQRSMVNNLRSLIGKRKLRHHHHVLAHFAERNFLKFSGALAAHAVARLERRNVADIAVVSHFV